MSVNFEILHPQEGDVVDILSIASSSLHIYIKGIYKQKLPSKLKILTSKSYDR